MLDKAGFSTNTLTSSLSGATFVLKQGEVTFPTLSDDKIVKVLMFVDYKNVNGKENIYLSGSCKESGENTSTGIK